MIAVEYKRFSFTIGSSTRHGLQHGMSSDDPPFKERKPLKGQTLKGQNWVGGNTAALGRWPDLYGLPPIMNDGDRAAEVQPAFARNARAASPSERALCTAIVEARGDGPAEHPYKEAGKILKKINKRLKSGGHKPVLVGVIYWRLKNSHVLKERG
jgi:hypothetical protein